MKVRRLDDNHDWSFGSGLSDYLTESEAIKQSVFTKLLSLKGDWFLNPEHGIAWFNHLKKNPNLTEIESEIKNVVLNTEGVSVINDFNLELDNNKRIITLSINYIDVYGLKMEVTANAPNNR